jgi:hypothetical protein
MWKDTGKIEDRKDLNRVGFYIVVFSGISVCFGMLLTAVIRSSFGWSIFYEQQMISWLFMVATMSLLYAIIVLRNLKVIESEQYRKIYRRSAYFVLVAYPFFVLWVYRTYLSTSPL